MIHRALSALVAVLVGAVAQAQTTDGGFAEALSPSMAAVVKAMLEHDDLTDVAVARAVTGDRAVCFTRARAMLPPEVQGKHRRSKNDEPGHGCSEKEAVEATQSVAADACGKR